MFLLKGHEDLRQDERVMQFFSLVNSLLVNDPETFRRNLAIQRFAVIPLSTNSGLIGWVPHSDTLHGLIKDYREKKKIVLNLEHRLMQRMSPDYDHLPLMNKVEVFEHSLELTQGDDLAKLMLLKSPSSEVWFDRRTNFTRSLAVMSMVSKSWRVFCSPNIFKRLARPLELISYIFKTNYRLAMSSAWATDIHPTSFWIG